MCITAPQIENLVNLHNPLVLRAALDVLHDRQAAEDVAQSTWLRAWTKWQEELPDCMPAWLRRVAKGEALKVRRARRGRGKTARPDPVVLNDEPAGRDEQPADLLERAETAALVERLPDDERLAVQ